MKNNRGLEMGMVANLIMGFIFIVLFLLPVLFTRLNGEISWTNVFKIWKDQALLIPVYAINHWVLAPGLLLKEKYGRYLAGVLFLVATSTTGYFYYETAGQQNTNPAAERPRREEVRVPKPTEEPRDRPPLRPGETGDEGPSRSSGVPTPIPPYAQLLIYSLLIAGVDSGLLFSKKWQENEEKRLSLEQKNTEMQLDMLRTQISPHFFMNTLNNIYSLIDHTSPRAKEAVMKLSKLMRYMLYESGSSMVKLSREFEFIRSYIDLMKLRYAEEMTIHLILPEEYADRELPPMLFVAYLENSFKFGASYQQESFINIVFEIAENRLLFTCINTRSTDPGKAPAGGLGLINNQNRLNLLFGSNYNLSVHATDKLFNVSLEIPLS